jgi:hypothetical protein
MRTLNRGFCATVFLVAAVSSSLVAESSEKPWAFRTPSRPEPPAVKDRAWVRNPIDAFILAKLEAAGVRPAAEADRATLLRRVTFDLIGLPPTPDEIDAFLADRSPNAYEKVVDRLLASPRHGERWATYWLDLVRYAETDGFKSDDLRPAAWRYRDYVIKSFNDDKPYDRFVKEQLAGDELYPDDSDALVATGFNRHYPDEYNAVNLEQRRQEILNDMTDTAGQVFLGLTVGCARCHDHKFDPISQEDYYRLQAFFAAYRPAEQPLGRSEEIEQFRARMRQWEEKTADVRRQMAEMEAAQRDKLAAKQRSRFPKEYQELLDLPAERLTPMQRQLHAMISRQVDVSPDAVSKAMKPEVRKQWQELAKQAAADKPSELPTVMTMTDLGPTAPATHLLKRGDWRSRGPEVAPGFIAIIDSKTPKITPTQRTSGRRSVLADWLTRPDNPLTARVAVNRLWQHHMGRGIVGTPGDFGIQGEPPSHPELLDWLATELVARKWSLKALHRLMVTSATYRQTSRFAVRLPGSEDPDNRLLGRVNRRRLEGEALRDAMLSVSGRLNPKAGGPSIFPEIPAEMGVPRGGWSVTADAAERDRRSVYVFAKRNMRYPLFTAFDAPDGNELCTRRHRTTTAPQALMLLNGKLTLDLARSLAERVRKEAGPEPSRIVEHACRLALGRSPDETERKTMLTFLDRGPDAVVDLCHVLLNLNEFLYVD